MRLVIFVLFLFVLLSAVVLKRASGPKGSKDQLEIAGLQKKTHSVYSQDAMDGNCHKSQWICIREMKCPKESMCGTGI